MRLVPSLLLLSAGLSAADQADTADPLPAGTLVITADRIANTRERTTATVDVIDAGEIGEKGHPGHLWQLLSGTPGVDLALTGGIDGGTVGIRLRGSQAYDTKVLLDGIPLTDPSTTQGQGNLAFLDPVGIERIEVVRGAQSGLWGSDAVAGVVNVLTARPTRTPMLDTRVEAGSYGTARVEAVGTGPLNDWAGFAVSAARLHSDGFSAHTDADAGGRANGNEADAIDRTTGTARVEVRPLDAATLYVAVRGDAADQEYDGSDASFKPDPPDTTSRNQFRSLRAATGGELHLAATRVSLDAARTATTRTDITHGSENLYRSISDFAALHADTAILEPAHERGWAVDRLDLGLGADWRHDGAVLDAYGASSDNSERQTGVYGQVLVGDRWLEFSQNARLDRHTTEGDNLTWRSGLAAFPVERVKIHGSFGTAFRAPSLYELFDPYSGNAELQAQRSRSYDFGHETVLPGGVTVSNVAFRTDYTQSITYASSGSYQNTGDYRLEGVESTVRWRNAGDGPRLLVSWTWQRSTLSTEDILNNVGFTGLPRNKVTVRPAWYRGPWWGSLTVDGVGPRDAYGAALPGYATLGAAVGYALSDRWELYARGENLTNTAYEVNPGYATAGLSGYGGVTGHF